MPDEPQKTVEIDADQVAEEIKEKITAEITPRITEEVTAEVIEKVTKEVTEKAITAAKQDLAEKITGKPVDENAPSWVKENRVPKDYQEVAEYGKDQALKEFEARDKAKAEAATKQTEEAKKTDEEKQKKWNDYWENQLKVMTDEGKLPAVDEKITEKLSKGETLTDDEKKDEGLQARAELFATAKEKKESNLELVWYKHLQGKKPAGATAPVMGSSRATTRSDKTDWTYEELHGARTMQDLMK